MQRLISVNAVVARTSEEHYLITEYSRVLFGSIRVHLQKTFDRVTLDFKCTRPVIGGDNGPAVWITEIYKPPRLTPKMLSWALLQRAVQRNTGRWLKMA